MLVEAISVGLRQQRRTLALGALSFFGWNQLSENWFKFS